MVTHVVYEKDMWDWARARLQMDLGFSPARQLIQESLLLHGRVLTEFFMAKPKMDDVVATHYVPEWASDDSIVELEVTKRSLDKYLAHLTAGRLDDDANQEALLRWNNGLLAIQATWQRFLSELAVTERSWFDEEIGKARIRWQDQQ